MAVDWLARFAGVLRRSSDDDRAARVGEIFYRRSLHESTADFLATLLDEFPAGSRLDDATLARLIAELRGPSGVGAEPNLGDDATAHLQFWRSLAERTGSPYAAGCYADTLLATGDAPGALAAFLDVFERAPALLRELGDDLEVLCRRAGGDAWLRYRIAAIRADLGDALADPDDAAGEAVREQYSDLLDELGDDPRALERIRAVGRDIDAAVERGQLPRAMVRRRTR